VTDLDGNQLYDLTGSYGVNLFGNDFYKQMYRSGREIWCASSGPVLGSYHPVVIDNVRRLKTISGMDEVTFHMSGTEAVMQAVRLARYHTGRNKVVQILWCISRLVGRCATRHWQPHGRARHLHAVRNGVDNTLRVLRKRNDIACILVNPLQALASRMRRCHRLVACSTVRAEPGLTKARYIHMAEGAAQYL
jgi:glutamate-1-semialdehyde 2,1-aminomutase